MKLAGQFVQAIGFMIVALCGTCTLLFGAPSILQALRGEDNEFMGGLQSTVATVAIVGLIPASLGVLLVLLGGRMARKPGSRKAHDDT
jgi:hypothetical protein